MKTINNKRIDVVDDGVCFYFVKRNYFCVVFFNFIMNACAFSFAIWSQVLFVRSLPNQDYFQDIHHMKLKAWKRFCFLLLAFSVCVNKAHNISFRENNKTAFYFFFHGDWRSKQTTRQDTIIKSWYNEEDVLSKTKFSCFLFYFLPSLPLCPFLFYCCF